MPAFPARAAGGARPGAVPGRALLLLVLATWLAPCRKPAPDLPRVAGEMDPEVARRAEALYRAAAHRHAGGGDIARLGMLYQAHGFHQAAAACFEQALAREPGSVKWSYLRALALADLGRLEEAEQGLAPALGSGYPPAHNRLGFWLLDQGRMEEAEREFRAALGQEARSINAILGLARIEIARGEPAAARSRLEALLGREPGIPYAHHLLGTALRALGHLDEASIELARGLGGGIAWGGQDPWTDEMLELRAGYKARLDQARSLVRAGRAAQAAPILEALRRDYPGDVVILTDLASLRQGLGQPAAALEAAGEAVAAHPDSFAAHLVQGQIHQAQGNLERALTATREALRLNPGLSAAHTQLGTQLLLLDRDEEARQALREALKLRPEEPDALLMMGRALSREGKLAEALEHFEHTTRLAPDRAEAWLLRGASEFELGRVPEAVKSFETGVKAAPGDPALRDALARARSDPRSRAAGTSR